MNVYTLTDSVGDFSACCYGAVLLIDAIVGDQTEDEAHNPHSEIWQRRIYSILKLCNEMLIGIILANEKL